MPLPILGKKMVVPSDGDMSLQCGKCGCTNFAVHVKPAPFDAAQVTNIICNVCLKIFRLSPVGQIGGNAKLVIKNQKERKEINARYDT